MRSLYVKKIGCQFFQQFYQCEKHPDISFFFFFLHIFFLFINDLNYLNKLFLLNLITRKISTWIDKKTWWISIKLAVNFFGFVFKSLNFTFETLGKFKATKTRFFLISRKPYNSWFFIFYHITVLQSAKKISHLLKI